MVKAWIGSLVVVVGGLLPGGAAAQVVHAVYVVPSDRQERDDYRQAIDMAVRDVQWFYQAQIGDGRSFALDPAGVLVLHSSHPTSWFGTHQPHGFGTFYDNVRGDVEALTGRVQGSLHAGPDLWALYVDAQPVCGQCGGCGGGRVTVIARNDLRGLVGEAFEKVCPTDADTNTRCRWIGGLGHELGHAMGLQHPAACDAGLPSCDWGALMFTGYASYPNTYLRADDKLKLNATPYLSWQPPLIPAAVCGPVAPAAPGAFAAAADGRTLRFRWNVPQGGGAPRSYSLRVGSAPGLSNLVTLPVSGPTTEHELAAPPGSFHFQLLAHNAFGTSEPSNSVRVVVGLPGPAGIVRSRLEGRVAVLDWPAITDAVGYQLEAGSLEGAANLAVLTVTTARFVSPPLPPGRYFVRVKGRNALGVGAPSPDAVIDVPVPSAPGAPTALVGTVHSGGVMLAWQAPAGGATGLAYVVEAGAAPGLANLGVFAVGKALSLSAPGVPPGRYYVRVRAANEVGSGPPSNEILVTVAVR